MSEVVYDPLERYQKEFEQKFFQVADNTFQQLEAQSGVDRNANIALCLKIKKLEADKEKVKSKTSFFRGLRIVLVVLIVILAAIGFVSYEEQQRFTYLHLLVGSGIIGLCSIIFAAVNPRIKNLDSRIRSLEATIEGLKKKAWEQMKPLNDLYTWDLTTSMIQQVVPKLEFDKFVHQGRLQELIDDYGLADLPETQSVLTTQSGEINDNPFVVAQILSQEWGSETYYGTKLITWRVAVRTGDGDVVYVTRTQTLTASVSAPIPIYPIHNCLIYGNDAAPKLSFMRVPSQHSGDKDGFFDKLSKKRDMKRLTKFSQNLKDESQYTLMSNKEFELLFETTNRTNEQEYRLLFTPLAQKQMLSLINDCRVGFGDDFSFRKQSKINVITAKHMNGMSLDTSPSRFYDYDIVRAEATFKRFNCTYFKSLYFAFAPLLAIPLYQQMKPLRKIYAPYEKQSSNWELESLVNYYGDRRFKGRDIETQSILKAQISERQGRDGLVTITAHGFYTEERLTMVPMLGGDGNMHSVPVYWKEYLPTSNTSSIMVREYEDNEFADGNQAVADEFCDVLSSFSCDGVLSRRNILSGIMGRRMS